jgi:hypothetical protein
VGPGGPTGVFGRYPQYPGIGYQQQYPSIGGQQYPGAGHQYPGQFGAFGGQYPFSGFEGQHNAIGPYGNQGFPGNQQFGGQPGIFGGGNQGFLGGPFYDSTSRNNKNLSVKKVEKSNE